MNKAKKRAKAVVSPDLCPGLSMHARRLIFTDCLGGTHDLTVEPWLSTREAAYRLKCHPETMLREVRAGEIYPIIRVNTRTIHVYECALVDYLARRTSGSAPLIATAKRLKMADHQRAHLKAA